MIPIATLDFHKILKAISQSLYGSQRPSFYIHYKWGGGFLGKGDKAA